MLGPRGGTESPKTRGAGYHDGARSQAASSLTSRPVRWLFGHVPQKRSRGQSTQFLLDLCKQKISGQVRMHLT